MDVQLLAASCNAITGDRIATFLIGDFPKCLLAELNTHKLMASNAESSRARPTNSVTEQVTEHPYVPEFTINQTGMSGQFLTDPEFVRLAQEIWADAMDSAQTAAHRLDHLGIHKQDKNRLLEPFLRVSVIITATQHGWDNFFKLRNHPAAQPAFKEYAAAMQELWNKAGFRRLQPGEWHKPWPTESIEINAGKAAGISYANHNRDMSNAHRIKVHDNLISADPMHGSPLEHCALAIVPGETVTVEGVEYTVFDHFNPLQTLNNSRHDLEFISVAKFGGFLQHRKLVEKTIEKRTHDKK